MALFLAVLIGEGEGCDHTIGCNKDFRIIESTNKETALNQVATYYGYFNYDAVEPNFRIKEINIYEVGENYLYSKNMVESYMKAYDEFRKIKNEKSEKELYEELKKKFENNSETEEGE